MALAGPVLADHADALAKQDLGTKRPDQSGKSEILEAQRNGAGATAAQPDRDLLIARRLDDLRLLVEQAEPALRGPDFRAPRVR